MIQYEFKGATSALYSTDGTREIIEHKNGSYMYTGVLSEHWKQRTTDYKVTL